MVLRKIRLTSGLFAVFLSSVPVFTQTWSGPSIPGSVQNPELFTARCKAADDWLIDEFQAKQRLFWAYGQYYANWETPLNQTPAEDIETSAIPTANNCFHISQNII